MILLNYSVFRKTVIIRSSKKVALCKQVPVNEAILKIARELINSAIVPTSPIKTVKHVLAAETIVSIKGTITKVCFQHINYLKIITK